MFGNKKKYVTQEQLTVILRTLKLVDDISYYEHSNNAHPDKSDKWYQNIGGKCLDEVVERLDNDDNAIIADLELVLDHFGLEITEKKDRRIVKKIKKGKK